MPNQLYQCHLLPFGSSVWERRGNALRLARPHGELHGHNRQAHDDQKHQINYHKGRTAVLPYNVGKAPHVAQADGTPAEMSTKPSRDANVSLSFKP